MLAKKIKFIAGFAVIVICLLVLVFSSSKKMGMYYFTVTELEAKEIAFVDKRIKLAGKEYGFIRVQVVVLIPEQQILALDRVINRLYVFYRFCGHGHALPRINPPHCLSKVLQQGAAGSRLLASSAVKSQPPKKRTSMRGPVVA